MIVSAYGFIARTALGSLTGQGFAWKLFPSLGNSQVPALTSALSYTVISAAGIKLTKADYTLVGRNPRPTESNTWKSVGIHLVTLGGVIGLTPHLTHYFFQKKISYSQAGCLTAGSFLIHLIPGSLPRRARLFPPEG
ncbi:MAG: hypothetical protein KDK64_07325 [Chlamydiia bacterium]|nr:hypothetical protein [Chlamydiia bacterium]